MNDEEPSPFHEAAASGKLYTLRKLVMEGADINFVWRGQTPLMWAAWNMRINIVRYLLQCGADVNKQGHEGGSPLRSIVRFNGDVRQGRYVKLVLCIVQLLVEAGANPNIQDEIGFTPLMYAASDGNSKLIRLLLSLGASPDVVSNSKMTALLIAKALLKTEIYHCQDVQVYLTTYLSFERTPEDRQRKLHKIRDFEETIRLLSTE